ncbi:MAG: homocysteine S-methyltransferase family protein [Kiritimatiellae bacterium]|nr:homocysteine S-methyltransferase family protein [Kiritimatiellia bacterium]
MDRLEVRALQMPLVCDGGMGTQLQARGLQPGECPELWCIDHPNLVKAIHEDYRKAGSQIVETNTFCASVYKLREFGLEDRMTEINEAGVRLAREVAGTDQYVMASMGPTGAFMEPYGDETEENFYAAFKGQAIAFERAGADAVIVETMTGIEECCVAVRAVRENTNLTCIASFTFDPQPDGGYASMMGVTPEIFVEQAKTAGAQIIGTNCGTGPDDTIRIVRAIRAVAPDMPIIAQPNAGLPELRGTETVFPETPEEMAAKIPQLLDAGANIIGGCCGTTPAHIAAFVRAIRS